MTRPHGGKGSASRPQDYKKFNSNWDKVFGKKPLDDKNPES